MILCSLGPEASVHQSQLYRKVSMKVGVFEIIVSVNSLLGFGVSNVGLRGIWPFSMDSIAFIKPEIPAAGSECPILLLICSRLSQWTAILLVTTKFFGLKLTDPMIRG